MTEPKRGSAHFLAVSICLSFGVIASPTSAQASKQESADQPFKLAVGAQSKAQEALDATNPPISITKSMVESERAQTAPSSPRAPFPETGDPLLCVIDKDAPRRIVDRPNDFHQNCLELNEFSDFDTLDLNLQVQGSSDGGTIAVLPSYTMRWGPFEDSDNNDNGFRTQYFRIEGGFKARIDPGKKTASFADLTEPEIVSGLQGILGFEVGGSVERRAVDYYTERVRRALLEARRECITTTVAELVTDPLNTPPSPSTRTNSREDAVRSCEGEGLSRWMGSDQRKKRFFRSVVQPIWEVNDGLRYYVGLQGTYAKPTYEFFPLKDPAMTGVPIITDLPTDFPNGATPLSEEVYSLKAYGGLVLDDLASAGLALSYRRDFAFPKGTADQTLCSETAGTFTICYDKNIAPPYELEGFVLGGRFGFDVPRLGFLPPFAAELKPSYTFDVEQFGIQGSLFFVSDSAGKQRGGIVVGCTDDGTTPDGFALQGECKASLFFGTTFSLDGKP